ncbi:MAG: PEP/pyruvate-binding domain-containing protein [Bacteroidales bacterium]
MELLLNNHLTGGQKTDYAILMEKRIKRVLMICSSYDAYTLEEDGQIETQIYQEYNELNISNPPSFKWVTTASDAKSLICNNSSFDLIISMFNTNDIDIFNLSKSLKKQNIHIPLVLLTNFSKEIFKRISSEDRKSVDYIFSWHGNADLILAIIKLIEDKMNADRDILDAGVQAILLVEDSIRYYSTYLPTIYKLILQQSAEFLKDTLNEHQQKLSKRARPKILLATNYEDAIDFYRKYSKNLLGIISDIGFVMNKTDRPDQENLEAGLQLAKLIRDDNPHMPILLQSSQESMREKAEEIGCGFLVKYSLTLLMELSEYIAEEFVFGDFIFRDLITGEIIGRAKNLKGMQSLLMEIPEDVFLYHTSRNRLSKWLYSRGLFALAADMKSIQRDQYDAYTQMRGEIIEKIKEYRIIMGQGVVAKFRPANYNKYIWFAKLGEGSLGGKARGLAFVNNMLQKYRMLARYDGTKIMIPRSIVIATDYFDQFIKQNGLQYVISSKTTDDELLSEFVSSKLPEKLSVSLKAYLETVSKPLAVRSSSKLEDSHYQPFAGIYSTYMIPVTENKDQMLRLLEKAIKSVYASVFFAASRSYIHTTSNLLGEEKMAVLIQDLCGTEDGGYYFPTISGVARSINYYPLGEEKPEDGIVTIAFGLGKLIVDGGQGLKFSPKYPKKAIQLSTPKLALRDTQEYMYALDLAPEQFKTSINDSINLTKFSIQEASKFRNITYVASSWDMYNDRIVHNTFDDKNRKIITFANILQFDKMPLAPIVSDLLKICQEELRCLVEIEFAVNMDVPAGSDIIFTILQVRPITSYDDTKQEIDWKDINPQASFIYADNALGPGSIDGITDIIYVKSTPFDKSKTEEMAKEIDVLNRELVAKNKEYILIGPGRWGSSNPWLGIPIAWNNISGAKVIVEYGLKDFPVEPSQGTHFFQNITSLGVGYLTVTPHMNEGVFKEEMLNAMPAVYESTFLRHIQLEKQPLIHINGKEGKGVIIL